MSEWKRRILFAATILVLALALLVPSALYLNYKAANEAELHQQQLLIRFIERYGPQATLQQVLEPRNLIVYVWEEDGVRHYTLVIDGLFVELGTMEGK